MFNSRRNEAIRTQVMKVLIMAAFLALLLLATSSRTYAAEIQVDGTYPGTSEITWQLDTDGVLTLTKSYGNGVIPSEGSIPWSSLSAQIKTVEVGTGIANLGAYSFANCTNLTSVSLPDTLTEIGRNAFANCDSLEEITIPGSVETLDVEVFLGCDNLDAPTLSEGIKTIRDSAFQGCVGMKTVVLPDSISNLGAGIFNECEALATVTLPANLSELSQNLFYGCKKLTNITIPDSVLSIGKNAFYNCTGLESIVIPDKVTGIGNSAFYSCTKLKKAILPDSLVKIDKNAFSGCTSLLKITVPDGTEEIGENAFNNCGSLYRINIPASVTSIDAKAFTFCNSNLDLYVVRNSYAHKDFETELNKVVLGEEGEKGVILIDDTLALEKGETLRLPFYRNADNYSAEISVASNDDSIASVNGFKATLNELDTTTVDVTADGVTKKITVRGCVPLERIEIKKGDEVVSGADTAMPIDGDSEPFTLQAVFYPENTTEKDVVWSQFKEYMTIKDNGDGTAEFTVAGCSGTGRIQVANKEYGIGASVLFKVGHKYGSLVPETVTCTKGMEAHYQCAFCKKYFDKDKNETTAAALKIETSGHNFTETVGEEYLKSAATCTDKAVYYKSCSVCGEKSTETFESGEALGHNYANNVKEDCLKSAATCTDKAVYYKSCSRCGEMSEDTFESGEALGHDFTAEVADAEYLKKKATVSNQAVYYKSCTHCGLSSKGQEGEATFSSGDKLPNPTTDVVDSSVVSDSKLLSVLTVLVNYWDENSEDFNDVIAASYVKDHPETEIDKVDPDTVDITALSDAAAYKDKPLMLDALESYPYTINLAPYNIKDLKGLNNALSVTSVRLPGGLQAIPDSAFYNMQGLESVTMPESVAGVGESAFENCTSLKTVGLYGKAAQEGVIDLSNVKSIGVSAFTKCESITNAEFYTYSEGDRESCVTEGKPALSIGSNAFSSCTSLEAANIPYASLGDGVFTGCTGLKSAVFDNAITYIPKSTFSNTKPENGYLEVTLPAGLKRIGSYAFSGSALKVNNLNACEGLLQIDEYAFEKASFNECQLDLSTSGNLKTIGMHAFSGTSFTDGAVKLPDSIEKMGISVFYDSGLTDINIPHDLEKIPDGTFMGCYDLENVTVNEGGLLNSKPAVFTSVGAHAFDMCGNLTNMDFLALTSKDITIGEYAFARCAPKKDDLDSAIGLTSIVIPDNVSYVAASAFENDFRVQTATVGKGVTVIPDRFMICEDGGGMSFTDVTLTDADFTGQSVTYKFRSGSDFSSVRSAYSGYGNISKRSSLANVTIEGDVTSIGSYAFYGNTRLEWLRAGGSTSDGISLEKLGSLKEIKDNAFALCADKSGSLRTDTRVLYGITAVQLPDSVTTLGKRAFYGDYNIETAALSPNIEEIPESCFEGCGLSEKNADNEDVYTGLTTVSGLSSLQTIGNNAFYKCYALSGISSTAKVTLIGNNGFRDCYSLADFNFGKLLKSVGTYCFAKTTLTKVDVINTKLDAINNGTFEECSVLKEVDCPDDLSSIGENVFRKCSSLKKLYCPVYTSLHKGMFGGANDEINVPDNLIILTRGKYKGVISRVPVGLTVELPADALARSNNETIAYNDPDSGEEISLPEETPKYYIVEHDSSNNKYNVEGVAAIKNTNIKINAEISFNNTSLKVNAEYPVDVIAVCADPESVAISRSAKVGNNPAGTIVTENGKEVLYVGTNNLNKDITFTATATAYINKNENENSQAAATSYENIMGMITAELGWAASDDAVLYSNGSTRTPGSKQFTTTSNFTIKGMGDADISVNFTGDGETPPDSSDTLSVKVIEPISDFDFYLDSIDPDHSKGRKNYGGTINIPAGTKDQITLDEKYASGDEQLDFVNFTSSNTDVITVDEEGNIEAVGTGTATVTMTTATYSRSKSQTFKVVEEQSDAVPAYIDIEGSDGTYVYVGEESEFTAECFPTYTNQEVSWSTNDSADVSAVKKDGKIILTGVNPNVRVRLTAATAVDGSSKSSYVDLTTRQKATSLEFREAPVFVIAGNSSNFVMSSNQNQTGGLVRVPAAASDDVTFTSSDESILALGTSSSTCTEKSLVRSAGYNGNSTLYYKGLTAGKVTITAESDGGKKDTLDVVVIGNPITAVDYVIDAVTEKYKNQNTLQMPVGAKDHLTSTVTYTSEDLDKDDYLIYLSSDEGVVKVDSEGNFEAVKEGTARITVKPVSNRISGRTFTVDVKETQDKTEPIWAEMERIDVAEDSEEPEKVFVGEPAEFEATFYPSYACQKTVWTASSSDVEVTKDGEKGIVSVVNPNKTFSIYGASEIKTNLRTNTIGNLVTRQKATELRFIEEPIWIASGNTASFVMSNNESQSGGMVRLPATTVDDVTFTTSDPEVLTLGESKDSCDETSVTLTTSNVNQSKTLYFKGVSDGRVTITAETDYGVKSAIKATVIDAPVTGIVCTETKISLREGKTAQMKYKITPRNSTETVTFDSDDTSVATVDEDGIITAVKSGEANIFVRSHINSKSAYCAVTVQDMTQPVEGEIDASVMPDDKLRSVLAVLTNYWNENNDDFYDVVKEYAASQGKSVDDIDITAMPAAADYLAEPLMAETLENYRGTINLAPYEITDLEGLRYAQRVTAVRLPRKGLTAIPANTFLNMKNLETVTMPESVVKIGGSAFESCSSLASVRLYGSEDAYSKTADLSKVKSIGNSAFSSCESLNNIVLYAYTDSEYATSVKDGSPVLTIDSNAFASCLTLDSADIPYAALGDGVFTNCSNLQTVVFDDAITYIPKSTLSNIASDHVPPLLMSVTLPAKLERIGSYAFHGTTVKLLNLADCTSLSQIDEYAFDGAYFKNCQLDLSANKKLTTIGMHAFSSTSFTDGEVRLPDCVSRMGISVFYGSELTAINIPHDLEKIPDGTFMGCYDLVNVTVNEVLLNNKPAKFASVGAHAFDMCGNLANMDFLGKTLQRVTVGEYAFARCVPVKADLDSVTGLTEIVIPDNVAELADSAFENDFAAETAVIGKGVSAIPDRFMICEEGSNMSFTDVVLTDDEDLSGKTVEYNFLSDSSFKTLRDSYAGYGNIYKRSSLKNVTIEGNITSIGSYAFYGNSKLEWLRAGGSTSDGISLEKLNSLTEIKDYAFALCADKTGTLKGGDRIVTGITAVSLPKSVETLGTRAFYRDFKLSAAALPAGLEEIPEGCFEECGLTEIDGNNITKNTGLTTVSGLKELTAIGNNAFYKCYKLTGITSLDKLETIGNNGFRDCYSLATFNFGKELSAVGTYGFSKSGLTQADLSQSQLAVISDRTFDECSDLAEVKCSDELTTIADNAFRKCSSLKQLEFPVYAKLSNSTFADMDSSAFTDLVMKPTHGRFRGTAYRVPVGLSVDLPADAFARYSSETITYVDPAGGSEVTLPEDEAKYFTVTHDSKNNKYIIEGVSAVRSADIKMNLTVGFSNGPKGMNLTYPVDVIGVYADPDTVAVSKTVKIGNGPAGTFVKEGSKEVLYVGTNNLNKDLTFTASAEAYVNKNENESDDAAAASYKDIKGMITAELGWKTSDDAVLYSNGSTRTPGSKQFTTTSNFTVKGMGDADISVNFTGDGETPPDSSDTLSVKVIEPISDFDYYLDSIDEDHSKGRKNYGGTINIPLGTKDQITLDEKYASGDEQLDFVNFTSSNTDVITVDEEGNIEAVGTGTASVTMTTATYSRSKSQTFKVVEDQSDAVPAYIDIEGSDGTYVYVGEESEFTAECFPTYTNQEVSWSTNDSADVSAVKKDGKIILTGVNPNVRARLTAVTAVDGSSKSSYVDLTTRQKATSLEFREAPVFVIAGNSSNFVMSSNQNQTGGLVRVPAAASDDVTFTSSDESILALGTSSSTCTEKSLVRSAGYNGNSTLYYKGLTAGKVTITAESDGGKTDTLDVVVIGNPITAVDYVIDAVGENYKNQNTLQMHVGAQDHLTSTVTYTSEELDKDDYLIYLSSDESVVKVDSEGNFEAVGTGTARITVRPVSNRISGRTFTVTVKETQDETEPIWAEIKRIDLDEEAKEPEKVFVGEPAEFEATFYPSYACQKTVWTASSSDVAVTKDGERGKVAVVNPNKTFSIYAVSEIKTNLRTNTISNLVTREKATELRFIEDPIWIASGNTGSFVMSNNESQSGGMIRLPATTVDDVTFTTSDPEVLTLGESKDSCDETSVTLTTSNVNQSKTLYFKGVSDGSVTITAETPYGVSSTLKATVVDAPITGMSCSEPKLALREGKNAQMKYKITPRNSTETVTFESDDTSVATVDENGLITGVKEGTAVVFVRSHINSKFAYCTVTVHNMSKPAEGEIDAAYMPDDKLRSVLAVLTNYWNENNDDFYDVVKEYAASQGKSVDDIDITAMPAAADYLAEPLMAETLENYRGTINLAPYEITDLEGLRYAQRVTEVRLPKTGLTSIPSNTFYNMKNLESVTMPKSVVKIGGSAFESCSSLASVRLYGSEDAYSKTADLSKVKSIGNSAFSSCESLNNIVLYAYTDSEYATSVKDGSPVLTIDSSAFASCLTLDSADIPYAALGDGVFTNCSNLQTVVFDDAITYIPKSTLSNIASDHVPPLLMSVTLPAKLERIGSYAFHGTTVKLLNLADCANLTQIDEYAFEDAYFRNCQLDLSANKKLTTIGMHAFSSTSFTDGEVRLPDCVSKMGISVFYGSGLTDVNIPHSMDKIPDGTFMCCYDLANVTVNEALLSSKPANFASVGAHAFDMCGNLANMDFLTKTQKKMTIGEYAFARCVPVKADLDSVTGLTEIVIPDNVSEVAASAFENDFAAETAVIGKGVTVIPDRFMICEEGSNMSFTDVTLTDDEALTGQIVVYSFKNDSGFKAVRDAYSGYGNIYKRSSLKNVTIEGNITSIGSYAFYGHSKLEWLRAGGSTSGGISLEKLTLLSEIKEYAFALCADKTGTLKGGDRVVTGIRTVKLPDSVETLGTRAFYRDFNLTSAALSPNIEEIPEGCFEECGLTEKDSNDITKNSGLATISGLKNLTAIGNNAFYRCYWLTSLTSLDNLETIGNNAFRECYNLATFDFGKKLTTLGTYSFCKSGLTQADLLQTQISVIANGAFEECPDLAEAACPDELTSINDNAFRKCGSLKQLEFPVYAKLSNNAFSDMDSSVFADLVMKPTHGRFRGAVYRIPVGLAVDLPADAFARYNSETISYVDPASGNEVALPESEAKYFTVTHDSKNNKYNIEGVSTIKGADIKMNSTIGFRNGSKSMSLTYPVDVVAVGADPSTIEFDESGFKFGSSAAGTLVTEGDSRVLYLGTNNLNKDLSVSAFAKAYISKNDKETDEKAGISYGEIRGMITVPVSWTSSSEETLAFKSSSSSTGKEKFTANSVFTVKSAGDADVSVNFEGLDPEPEASSKSFRISVIEPISDFDFYIDSIDPKQESDMKNTSAISMPAGKKDKITLAAKYKDENDTRDFVTFTSNKPDIVTVDEDGNIEAVAAGTAEITMSTATKSKTRQLRVNVSAEGSEIAPSYIEISGSTGNIVYVGEDSTFTAKCYPEYASQDVTWSVNNTEVASLTEKDGAAVVNGIKANSGVRLTAKTAVSGSSLSKSIDLNCRQKASELKFVSESPIVVVTDRTGSFNVSNVEKNGGVVRLPDTTIDDVTFTSSDTDVLALGTSSGNCSSDPVTISNTSLTGSRALFYKGLKSGSATITAKASGGSETTIAVEVTSNPIKSISYTIGSVGDGHSSNGNMTISMPEGQSDNISVAPEYTNDEAQVDEIRYASSNTDVVTVDENGNLKAVGSGRANITIAAASGNKSCTITINVTGSGEAVAPAYVDIEGLEDGSQLLVGKTAELTAVCLPDYSAEAVTWTVSDSSSVTMYPADGKASDGKIKITGAKANENVTLTAKADNGNASAARITVRVREKAKSLKFRQAPLVLEEGGTGSMRLSSNQSQNDGIIRTPAESFESVTFTSSDPSVLKLGAERDKYSEESVTIGGNSADLYYNAVKQGTAVITAKTSSGREAKLKVSVSKKMTKFRFAKSTVTVNKGNSVLLELSRTPGDSTEKVSFVSSDKSIVKVNANGVVTAVKKGQATITATGTLSNLTASCVVKATDTAGDLQKYNGVLDTKLPKVKIKKAKAGKKCFTAKWKKLKSKKRKIVSGIEIEYSTSKSFKSPVFKKAGKSKASKKIKKLKKGKKYYVRMHTYVYRNGVKYVSSWSKTKKVKVK